MNGLCAATVLGMAGVFGPTFVTRPGGEPPPQAYTAKNATMPGKIPATLKSLESGWAYHYKLDDVRLETGQNGTINFGATYLLRADGTYQLVYFVRWNARTTLPVGLPGLPNIPKIGGDGLADGMNVDERGKFALSGEILLLQPEETRRMEIKDNRADEPQTLASENRAYVVRLDKKNLYMAGRCASWQIDPVCKEATDVRYKLTSQLGSKWMERER